MANDIKVVPDADFEKIQIDPSNLGSLATAIRNYTSVHNPGYTPAPVGTPTLAKQNQQEAIRQFDVTNQQNMQKWMFDNGLLGVPGGPTGNIGYSGNNRYSGNNGSYSGSNNGNGDDGGFYYNDSKKTIAEVTDDAKRRVMDLYSQNQTDPSFLEDTHTGMMGNVYNMAYNNPSVFPNIAQTTADDPLLYTIMAMKEMELPAGLENGMGSKWLNNQESVSDLALGMNNVTNSDDYMAELEKKASNQDAQTVLNYLKKIYNKD